jgi:tRNA uridine 5-carboxymethylaminomethyl modification enzyme
MFTSRAEFRTLLRQDNADLRLTERSYRLGLATQDRMSRMEQKQQQVEIIKQQLFQTNIEPEETNPYLESVYSSPLVTKQKAAQVLTRPGVDLLPMMENIASLKSLLEQQDQESLEQAAIQIKYATYIEKERELVEKMSQLENRIIPDNFDYLKLTSLSAEARQKFNKIRPKTIGQASRISGVNPSDVQILMVYMGR